MRGWVKVTGNEEVAALVLPENKKQFESYLWGREFLDLLEQYPAQLDDPQQLFKLLTRLAPRLYSISSSQALYPDAVHLSVRVVLYESYRRKRQGVCSGQIGKRTPVGAELPIFIHSNRLFRLPEDLDAPVVTVGPGTGVAPFRAFLQHKQADAGAGRCGCSLASNGSRKIFSTGGEPRLAGDGHPAAAGYGIFAGPGSEDLCAASHSRTGGGTLAMA